MKKYIILYKYVMLIISLTVLSYFVLLKNGFYRIPTYKNWGKLYWKDFEGISKPFAKYDARIYSDIFMKYDEVKKENEIYAAQNNILSYVKVDTTQAPYLLKHEQYHFNLTEIYARVFRKFYKENLGNFDQFYQAKLKEYRNILNDQQEQYDLETAHGLNYDQQCLWEFRIDSTLVKTSENSQIFYEDEETSATIMFTEKPSYQSSFDTVNNYTKNTYYLKKYNMYLKLVTYQYNYVISTAGFQDQIKSWYDTDQITIQSIENDSIGLQKEILLEINNDSGDYIFLIKWITNDTYLYQIVVRYPNVENVEGYRSIANSFFNSFEIKN